jgi:hypothetical protein
MNTVKNIGYFVLGLGKLLKVECIDMWKYYIELGKNK